MRTRHPVVACHVVGAGGRMAREEGMPGASIPLVYTQYSLRRMAQRNIAKQEVQAVVDSRSKVVRPSRHGQGRRVHSAEVGGRKVSVVVGATPLGLNTVITVWDEWSQV